MNKEELHEDFLNSEKKKMKWIKVYYHFSSSSFVMCYIFPMMNHHSKLRLVMGDGVCGEVL